MKSLISYSLSLALIIPPQFVWAEDPMDAAVKAVTESMQAMSAKALAQVEIDFNAALADSFAEFYNQPDIKEVRSKLFTEQKTIASQFNDIAKLDPISIARVQQQVEEAFNRYRSNVRRRYDASYLAADLRARTRESLLFARRALLNFERTCASGSGVGGLGAEAFAYPSLPPPSYSVSVNWSSDGNYSANAEYNGTGSKAERDRNNAMGATWTAASIATSVAVNGGTGSVVAACTTAAPYLGAAAVVVTLASLYLSRQERIKAENRIVEAQVYAFSKMATDADAARYYREHCSDLKIQTRNIVGVLDLALSNPSELKKRSNSVAHLDREIADYRQLLAKRQSMLAQVKSGKLSKEEVTAQFQALAALDKEIQKKSNSDQVANVMLNFLVNHQAELEMNMADIHWQAIDLAQRRAFNQVTKILTLLQRQSFGKFVRPDGEIGKELLALDRFLEARKTFQETLAFQVKAIFGRVSQQELSVREDLLRQQVRGLISSYGHNPQVMNFARQAKALVGEI